MIPPPCECGHSMYSHTDKHGYFIAGCNDCGTGGCNGYAGHSELILDGGPS